MFFISHLSESILFTSDLVSRIFILKITITLVVFSTLRSHFRRFPPDMMFSFCYYKVINYTWTFGFLKVRFSRSDSGRATTVAQLWMRDLHLACISH